MHFEDCPGENDIKMFQYPGVIPKESMNYTPQRSQMLFKIINLVLIFYGNVLFEVHFFSLGKFILIE